jgi:hypothetical protein
LGHVTDANGIVSTRELTLADLGYSIPTLDDVTSAGNSTTNSITVGDLAVDGGDITTTSATLNIGNTATTAQTLNLATAATAASITKTLNIGTGGAASSITNINIGSANGGLTTIDSPITVVSGDLQVVGTVTTNNVEMVSTSNGIVFEGTVADEHELTLKAGVLTADRNIILPDVSDTVAVLGNIKDTTITITAGAGLATGGSFTTNTNTATEITLDHADTSNADSLVATSRTYISSLTLDEYGHVTALGTDTETVVDTDTWIANALDTAGYVAAPSGTTANKVWKTDGSGNPAWRDDEIGSNTATHADGIMDGSNSGTEVSYSPYTRITTTGSATNAGVSHTDNSGVLYTGTINPALSTRLNYNGYLYAKKLYSEGSEVLTSFTETDPIFVAHTAYNIANGTGRLQNDGAGNWSYDNNTYLTSFTETDPIFVAHTAYNIANGTGLLKNNGSGTWSYDNTAYLSTYTINAGGTNVVVDSNTDTVSVVGSGGTTVSGSATNDTITVSSPSVTESTNGGAASAVTSINFDFNTSTGELIITTT